MVRRERIATILVLCNIICCYIYVVAKRETWVRPVKLAPVCSRPTLGDITCFSFSFLFFFSVFLFFSSLYLCLLLLCFSSSPQKIWETRNNGTVSSVSRFLQKIENGPMDRSLPTILDLVSAAFPFVAIVWDVQEQLTHSVSW